MRNKKSVLMTLNHNYGCFSGVGSGIAGNICINASLRLFSSKLAFISAISIQQTTSLAF